MLGETGEDGRKVLRREEKLRLEVVVYDVDLTTDLGVEASMGSGGNAMAHAGEFVLSLRGGSEFRIRCWSLLPSSAGNLQEVRPEQAQWRKPSCV